MNKAIYFRRASKVAVNTNSGVAGNFAHVASLDANLRKLGYALDNTLAMALMGAPVDEITEIHKVLIREAKEIKGVRSYRAMYPNFPKQVMEASAAELYLNAIMHYFGDAVGLRILPVYDEKKRPELNFDDSKVSLVSLGSVSDYSVLLGNLLNSKSGFSETDKADIATLSEGDFVSALLESKGNWTNRENKAYVLGQVHKRGMGVDVSYIDTATDVLRFAAAISDGDTSLAENTRFRNFSRPERRLMLGALAAIKGGIVEDMMRHQASWKRLGERLHPGEFNQFPNVQAAFDVIRSNGSFESFNASVEKALAIKDSEGAARLLQSRPGEFARRLDKVLRGVHPAIQKKNLGYFSSVADKVSPTVLLQARNAFLNRDKDARVFFPKGSVAKMQSIEDKREALSQDVRNEVVSITEASLFRQFRDRDNLGGSWVDPALKNIAIPFGLRNASKAVKTLGRGSRLSLGEDTNVVRFFIWWHDVSTEWGGRTDIDLSAVMFDKNFGDKGAITFYNLRDSGAVHSGDITSAPEGASEFIDIDIDTLRKRGVRYVAMTLHSYSGQTLNELPECFAGFMERRDLSSGEIYDPRTVTNKADLTSNTRGATPFIFDLETREAIWVDLSMQISGGYSTVRSTQGQIMSTVQAMTTLTPPNLYDLFTIHAAARGGIVSKEEAKTIFSFDGDVTPFDSEEILANYL